MSDSVNEIEKLLDASNRGHKKVSGPARLLIVVALITNGAALVIVLAVVILWLHSR